MIFFPCPGGRGGGRNVETFARPLVTTIGADFTNKVIQPVAALITGTVRGGRGGYFDYATGFSPRFWI